MLKRGISLFQRKHFDKLSVTTCASQSEPVEDCAWRNFKYLAIVIVLMLFTNGCRQNNKSRAKESTNKYVSEHFGDYQSIYKLINDSIGLYVDSLISSYTPEYIWDWKIDSLLCINSESDKLVTTVNVVKGSCNDCQSDIVLKLLGKKINKRWFFFKSGESLIVPRDLYGKDSLNSLDFYQVSQIARKEFLEGMLQEQPDGSYKVNDDFIDYQFYNGYGGSERTKEQKDSIHWDLIRGQWNYRIDTNEYKPLKCKPCL